MSLFLSCNNGIEELQKRNTFLSSLANLGNDFLDVFTSFGDSLGGVLGFNASTKKSEVGDYFKKIETTVEGVKSKLNTIVENMKPEGNPNAEATAAVVKTLVSEKLDRIITGAKIASDTIGITGDELLGNVAAQNAGNAGTEVDNLVKGIKDIVDAVLKEGNADAGDANGPVKDATGAAGEARTASSGGTDGNAGKLFAKDGSGDAGNAAKAAKDASKAVGAVTGADILKAISTGVGSKAAVLALKILENVASVTAANQAKDVTIAGVIALRAMAKNGKFSGPSDGVKADVATAVKGAAVSAVTKALDTLTIAIRKTIDGGLKTVKDTIKINANDIPVTTESASATK
ncbi:variable large family protein (plasmid) [Borrelia coriaceae]|nr:variable large family protein [Borrelia coriaceae]UPA17334.1 variable large family protein [Borrelia coriaceae]